MRSQSSTRLLLQRRQRQREGLPSLLELESSESAPLYASTADLSPTPPRALCSWAARAVAAAELREEADAAREDVRAMAATVDGMRIEWLASGCDEFGMF